MRIGMIGRGRSKLLDLLSNPFEIFPWDMTNGKCSRGAFHNFSDLEALQIFAKANISNHEGAGTALDDQSLALEPLQGFAQRRPRNT